MQWISTKESLPKSGKDVLCYAANGFMFISIFQKSYYKSVFYAVQLNREFAVNEVTHWMPLPEPPRIEE